MGKGNYGSLTRNIEPVGEDWSLKKVRVLGKTLVACDQAVGCSPRGAGGRFLFSPGVPSPPQIKQEPFYNSLVIK